MKSVNTTVCTLLLLVPAIVSAQTTTIGLSPGGTRPIGPVCRAMSYIPDTIIQLQPISGRVHALEANAEAGQGDLYPDRFVVEVTDVDLAMTGTVSAISTLLNVSPSTCKSLQIVATLHEFDGNCYQPGGSQTNTGGDYYEFDLGGGNIKSICMIEVSWPISSGATKVKVAAQANTPGFPQNGEPTRVLVIGD